MKSKTAHSLIISLILTIGYLPNVTAVTDAELDALERQIETEEKKQAEAEAKHKAEKKRKAEEKRLSELEKQRLEEQQKRLEEERRKLEEEKRKLEEARLVELERKRQEEEAKQLALEEQKRKEEEKEEPFQDFFDEFFNDTKEPVHEDVKLNKKAAWLGVHIQDVPQDFVNQFGLSENQGVLIVEIVSNSPAKAAGLIQGDIILKFDKHEIHKLADLPSLVSSRNIGDIVPLEYLRNGEKLFTKITLGELNIK